MLQRAVGVLRDRLQRRHLPWHLAVLAMLLCAPSLWLGWQFDDDFHRAALRRPELPLISRSPAELYAFIEGDPVANRQAVVMGFLPWWSHEKLRLAFFRDGIDISQRARQLEIAEARGLPVSEIEACLDSGRAFAGFAADLEQAAALGVRVSPTVVFNEGRQRLNGNVGFRIIEANVRELLRAPEVGQSWC